MPAYYVEFISAQGPQRLPFTLDHGRPLGPQVRQILEELNQRGLVLTGGPDDELTIRWHGRTLSEAQTPGELGLSPDRPLELRLRRRPQRIVEAPVPRPEPAVIRFLPKGAYASPLAGAAGALAAWGLFTVVTELSGPFSSYATLDLLAALLIGALTAPAVLGADAARRAESVPRAALLGVLLGGVGALLGSLVGTFAANLLLARGDDASFLAARVVYWMILGAEIGALTAARFFRTDRRRVFDGVVTGGVAGALGALLLALPGPTDFWHAVAVMLLGAGVGVGACALALRRSLAILELESARGRRPGLRRLLEWPLIDGATVAVRVPETATPALTVQCEQGRCRALPAAEDGSAAPRAVVAGRPLTRPTELRNGDVVNIGPFEYRYRRRRPLAS